MKFLVSDLLLALALHALPSWGASPDRFVVTQTPDVSVMEGETVNIICCLTGEFGRARVNWLKNQRRVKSEHLSLINKTSDCSNLTFTKITRENSGRYTCEVKIEIPTLSEVNGGGTVITVTAKENTVDDTGAEDAPPGSDSSPLRPPVIISEVNGGGNVITVLARENTDDNVDPPIAGEPHWEDVLIYVMRCLPILALVVSFFCLNKLGTKAQQRAQVDPGNKLPSKPRTEEDQEEEGGDEGAVEAEENKNGDEESHGLSDVSSVSSKVEESQC